MKTWYVVGKGREGIEVKGAVRALEVARQIIDELGCEHPEIEHEILTKRFSEKRKSSVPTFGVMGLVWATQLD